MKRFKFLIASLMVAAFLASPAVTGQLYKWVDDQGNVHYGDSPPKNADLKAITGKISSYTSVSVEPFEYDPSIITQRKKSKTVIMYSTEWCGFCKKAKAHFLKKNIAFTEYDIEKSRKAAEEYRALKGRGVPVILIGEQRMNGFDAATFDRIYYGKS